MVILPIVERELRVAARQPKTWWRRVLLIAVAILAVGVVYADKSRNAQNIGKELFEALGLVSLVICLLAGPLATSDCISREKREDSLGLLFLTDLKGYDVVLGKLCAASIDMVFTCLGLLPLLALPMLMGGVTLKQYGLLALALVNIIFLSLAVGVWISTISRSFLKALVGTVLLLAFLTLGLPMIGIDAFHIALETRLGPYLYSVCPLLPISLVIASFNFGEEWYFWLSISVIHFLAWALVGTACGLVPRIWQVRPPSKLRRRWQEWYRGFSHGEQHERPRLRQKAFQVNPVTWLDSRDYTQTALLQIVVAAYFILCGFFDCGKFRSVISAEMIAAASVAVYYGICLWIAFRAGDRFIQDRQSGALELLLTTPLSTGEIVKGRMRGIHRQFSWAVAILGILAWFLVDADRIFSQDSWICKAVVLLFPLQTYTLARVGLCQGLKQKGLLQAVLASSLQVLLLPWLGFVAVVVCDDRLWRGNIGRLGIFYAIVWFVCHVVVCLGCLARANWKLKNHFRQLASEPISQWWRW